MSSKPRPPEARSGVSRNQPASNSFALKLDFTIPAQIAAISPLVETIMTAVRQHAKSKELAIETALREALTNAVRHGCSCDPSKLVLCSMVFGNADVLIVVSDPGSGFNPEHIPDPTEGENIFENHGRGIYLIHQLMDEVSFKRSGAEIHMRSRF